MANKNAVRIDPQSSEAHYNLAINQQDLGMLDEAVNSYIQAIELNPGALEPSSNLVSLLTAHIPNKDVSHPIVKVDRDVKEIEIDETSGPIPDDSVVQLFRRSTRMIQTHNIDLRTNFSEIFRRNSVDLNCERHLSVFDKFNVIPKFCFGCFKVQVEPRTLLELVKLFVVFDQLQLGESNIRKCMVEIRPRIPGFYKGLVYCSSPEEAYQIADNLERIVKSRIAPDLSASVKRGCSEYPLSYPAYKEVNNSGDQLMSYDETWQPIEEEYDSIHSPHRRKTIWPSLFGMSLSDILIIRNWIDYAKGIGDPSASLFDQDSAISQSLFDTAKKRLETYAWQGLSQTTIGENAR